MFRKHILAIGSGRSISSSSRGFLGVTVINRAETGVYTRFGEVTGPVFPGLQFYVPFIDAIIPVSNRVQEDKFKFEVKTKENTFVILEVAVQYRIESGNDSIKALFELEDPEDQMRSFVENVIRAVVPKKQLEQLFSEQEEISHHIEKDLSTKMKEYGFTIVNTLICSIDPDKAVKDAMNQVAASNRLKDAAQFKADATKITMIAEAEADSKRKELQGEGLSKQRQAILNGYKTGVNAMAQQLGVTNKDVMNFVLEAQKLDTWERIGSAPSSKVIFLSPNNSSSQSTDQVQELANAVMQANHSQ
jgi:regulator of protease activity HflC (stomatin/prohibitin superfamily)